MNVPAPALGHAPDNPRIARLTAKERECLLRWLDHATAKEIALAIGISHHAVEKRLKSARQKLGAPTSLDAARMLADAARYDRTAYGPAELAETPSAVDVQSTARTGIAGRPRNPWLIPGALAMTLTLLAALALAAQSPVIGSGTDTRVFKIDGRSDAAAAAIDQAATESFTRLDTDRSGFIEAAELVGRKFRTVRVVGGAANGGNATDSVASPMAGDADGDQRVSLDEFRVWMRGFLPAR